MSNAPLNPAHAQPSRLSATWQHLKELLVPHGCPLCRAPSNTYLCHDCMAGFQLIEHACSHCSLPLNHNQPLISLCAECLTLPPKYSQAICAYAYTYPLSSVISRFKDAGDYRAVEQACKILALKIRHGQHTLPDLLTPVPIHWRKHWRRGFNQSEVICSRLNLELGIPIKRVLKKTRPTSTQKRLTRKARLRNLSGSFKVCSSQLANKHIAIVDDVITTGSTISLLTELCLNAGAKQVEVWALARTPKSP